jgi:hypothetical protein
VLPSLLALDPADYGLPPFGDLVEGVIPLDPVFTISGNVVKGFGRGSKVGYRQPYDMHVLQQVDESTPQLLLYQRQYLL